MKKLICLATVLLCLSGCAATGDSPTPPAKLEPVSAPPPLSDGPVEWSAFPFPPPEGESCEILGGTLFCRGVDVAGFGKYRETLRAQGWQALHEADSLDWWFLKDDGVLHVKDQSFVEGYEEVRLDFAPGRASALPTAQALPLAQAALERAAAGWEHLKGRQVKHLACRDLPGMWEATGMQLFQAFDGETSLGLVLLGGKNDEGLFVFDGFSDWCAADIDGDGAPELLSLFGWGSGIFRQQLSAYKIQGGKVAFAYGNTWFPRGEGSWELRLLPVSGTEVHLMGGSGTDYGPLRLEGDKLKADNLPFGENMGG